MSDPASSRLSPGAITAVILAGGFGTRIAHLHPDTPKPMLPVLGKPFVEWVIDYLGREGIGRVVLATGYKGDVFKRYFQAHRPDGIRIDVVREHAPLGTAGGFLNAARAAGPHPAAWLVLNGDSLVLTALAPLFALLDDARVGGALVGVPVQDAARYGTLQMGPDKALLGFEEKRPGRGVVSAGMYLFRPAVLSLFPQKVPLSFETEVLPALIRDGVGIKVSVSQAPFLDIGTPETLPLAEAFIEASHLAGVNR